MISVGSTPDEKWQILNKRVSETRMKMTAKKKGWEHSFVLLD